MGVVWHTFMAFIRHRHYDVRLGLGSVQKSLRERNDSSWLVTHGAQMAAS